MKLNEYQDLSARTAQPHENELLNYGLGLAGETGEVVELIKKSMFHGHAIDLSKIENELGDVLWYLSQIARLAGVSLGDVAQANLVKLSTRYPHGFTKEDSIKRKDVVK
ncbi:nucleoside triphosphate pyrophosphohydrolase family protein [Virgibacillus doumboii]|uniref:nucleoside triphosphate pyrophosphohydrolase family protein n=1 Tax=Virgibacillus doumboii TaxID=2697503 RepID=UPI0013DFA215|nr:nucleoside triphosphate pyrophosphohydrolase family protein [Virgibacillus doumboii]